MELGCNIMMVALPYDRVAHMVTSRLRPELEIEPALGPDLRNGSQSLVSLTLSCSSSLYIGSACIN